MTRVGHEVVDSMLAALQDNQGAKAKLFVLIDGAQLRSSASRFQQFWPTTAARSLWPLGTADTAVQVGPLLFELPVNQLDRNTVESLVNICTGDVLGSFLLASVDIDDVISALSSFIDVQLDDGVEMVMRFYDPRILPFWLEYLPEAYRCHIGNTLLQWLYWGPDYEVQKMKFVSASSFGKTTPSLAFPLRLTSLQEAQFIGASTPYLILSRLRADGPEQLEQLSYANRYEFIRFQLEKATNHGLNALPDLEAYCGLAVALGASFDSDPAIESALQAARAGSAFGQAITALSGRDWKRIRESMQ